MIPLFEKKKKPTLSTSESSFAGAVKISPELPFLLVNLDTMLGQLERPLNFEEPFGLPSVLADVLRLFNGAKEKIGLYMTSGKSQGKNYLQRSKQTI